MTRDSFDRPDFGLDLDEFDDGLGPRDFSVGWQASGECQTCGSTDLRPEIFLVDGEHQTVVHCPFGHMEGP